MNRLKFVFGLLALGLAFSVTAQVLQFTNITLSTSPNLFYGLTNQLNSVVYDGGSNFVAVGANQFYVCGNFQAGQSWLTKSAWVTNRVLAAGRLNLDSVTLGGNLLVATGDSNAVFSAADNFASGVAWSQKDYIFGNGVNMPGLAYNGNGFSAVSTAPEIAWSTTNLTATNNWLIGTLTNIDFAESFRGITGYGANGFAACGLFGDVRLSSNGTNWQTAVSGLFGQPNLYGIAYDGTQTLVVVGATNTASSNNGIILVSTNSVKTNWQAVYVNKTSSTPINAVIYTGSGFIAVGNGGQVLTSSNGMSWTVQTNTASLNNLNGVAFANNGNLIGVGELVGQSGTVILAGTPPPAPINPVGATNCAAYPTAANNGTLSVDVVTDANHPAGTVTVDWYLNQTNLVASGVTSFTPTNNPNLITSNAPVNYTFNAVERDLRTGFTSAGTQVILQINPRPATISSPLNATDCNVGDSFVLTNMLTGIGPWTVYWNDGTIQVVAGSAPQLLTRTVFPTNPLLNAVSNNVYYVTNITGANTCVGNLPGDIIGTNTIVINPRPTASLEPLTVTNCNDGSPVTLTNTLTGIGPWVITWNDGLMQTNSQIGSGPATLTRTVSPTNTLANAASNNVYYVMSLADNTCTADQPGDITGTNLIVVNPLPTVTLTLSTNDFAVSTNGVSTGLLEKISNPLGSTYNLTVGFQYVQNGTPVPVTSQTLSVTNHLAFTGIGPWQVILSDGSKTTTNIFSSAGNYVWQETISTNTDTNFTFSVQSVQSTNTGCSEAPTNSYDVLVYGAPTALVYTTNTVCGSATNLITISAALGGFGPWTNVVWSDGFTNVLVTSSPFNRGILTPTNSTLAQIITNYSIVRLTDVYGATTTSSNDLTGSAKVIVDPYSKAAPVVQSSLNSSCSTIPIPLSVSVPSGFTAIWFDANTNLLTNGVTAYVAQAPGIAATNVYLVAAIYNDTNLNDSCISPYASITNVFENCSEQTSIHLTGTNVVISWNGNFILQGTTNLVPPVIWMNEYTGALGPNFLTNSIAQPPIDFFRLSSPTN